MKKLLLSLVVILLTGAMGYAQENQVNRIPKVGYDPEQNQYSTYERGFWAAAEAMGGISSHLRGHNMELAEIDVAGGYMFNQFIKVGAGLGARYYFNVKGLRRHNDKWGMPIYADVRGNFISAKYRRTVPYWDFAIGGSIRDGFMLRPSIGLRIGEFRQAFTIAFSYLGQEIGVYDGPDKATKFTSFFCLRLGFEY